MQQHVFAISQTCEQLGVKHAIICPGSRSAPLVFAFTSTPKIACYSVIDERSAAYMALGMAQQLQEPVAIICTSGTAALNFFPAIAEAYYQKVPLLVLTADRPPELLNQQDGQMIIQRNVYGKHVLGSFELPCYEHGKEKIKETINLVASAMHICQGETKGPVHINIPLREPLYPQNKAIPRVAEVKTQQKIRSRQQDLHKQAEQIGKTWNKCRKKLILVGQLPIDNDLFTPLLEFSNREDVAIICDVLSNKQSVATSVYGDFIISHSNPKQLRALEPDLLISLGGQVLSKAMKGWLKKQKPTYHFRIQQENDLVDTYSNVTSFLQGNPAKILGSVVSLLSSDQIVKTDYQKSWKLLDSKADKTITSFIRKAPFSELTATGIILRQLPTACNFHIANSSVIRYVSLIGDLDTSWEMNGNRGTSGIDGCTSTAVGAAMVNNRQTVLLTGDIGFLYDRNALWNQYVPANFRAIVFNNYGGGIFNLIDGPSKHSNQLSYFTTPHHNSIKNTVLDNGLDYYFCDTENELKRHLVNFFEPSDKPTVLEIGFDMKKSAEVFNRFKKQPF